VTDDDQAMYDAISERLVDASSRALGPWVEATVGRLAPGHQAEARAAGVRCAAEITEQLRTLVALDIDAQRSTPLALLRGASGYVAGVLRAAGVTPPVRDDVDVRNTPADEYGVGPSTWSDLGEEVGELGIAWGAAKAHLHLRRHRP